MTESNETAPRKPITREHIDELVHSLSIEQRAQLTSGSDAWHADGVESIGLKPMLTLDGSNDVRGRRSRRAPAPPALRAARPLA
jgi:hypothetical protein